MRYRLQKEQDEALKYYESKPEYGSDATTVIPFFRLDDLSSSSGGPDYLLKVITTPKDVSHAQALEGRGKAAVIESLVRYTFKDASVSYTKGSAYNSIKVNKPAIAVKQVMDSDPVGFEEAMKLKEKELAH